MVDSLFRDLMATFGRPALDDALHLYPHAIEIQSRVVEPGPDGDVDHEENGPPLWITFAHADAKITAQAGETASRGIVQQVGRERVTFEMLLVPGVTTAMRVVLGSKIYRIDGVYVPGERGVYTVLNCTAEEEDDA